MQMHKQLNETIKRFNRKHDDEVPKAIFYLLKMF